MVVRSYRAFFRCWFQTECIDIFYRKFCLAISLRNHILNFIDSVSDGESKSLGELSKWIQMNRADILNINLA